MTNFRFWVIGAAASLGACSLDGGAQDGAQMQGGQTGDEFGQGIQRLSGEAVRIAPDGMSARAAADELSSFAWQFYAESAVTDQSFVYSPYSLATAAAMLYAGAAGNTQSQMSDVFAFTQEGESFHQARNDLIQVLDSRNAEASNKRNAQILKISNDFWMAERLVPTDNFLNVLSAYYGAPVFLFEGEPEDVRTAINGKVSDDTFGLIPELLPPYSISPATIFVLTNALYFKANWFWAFNRDLTKSADFETIGGQTVSVDMMHAMGGEGYRYANVDGTDVLSIPYFGMELELVVISPASGQFESFRKGLDEETVASLTGDLQSEVINLGFPKMEVAYSMPLKTELIQAGMVDAFDRDSADFSSLASNKTWIAEAFHQTKVIIDEEGTEAAAATAFVGNLDSEGPTPIDVTINRPFVFFIRDIETGAVLFLGHYLGPT